MKVEDIVLFYSDASPASIDCKNIVVSQQLPIHTINVDPVKVRKMVMNPSEKKSPIKVHNVPTLFVLYEGGVFHKFEGIHKITEWLRITFYSSSESEQLEEREPSPKKTTKRKNQKKKSPKKKSPKQNVELIFEEEPPQPQYQPLQQTQGFQTNRQATRESDIMKTAKEMAKTRDEQIKQGSANGSIHEAQYSR